MAEALLKVAACAKALCENERAPSKGTKDHMAEPRGRQRGCFAFWELIGLTLENHRGYLCEGEALLPGPEQQCILAGYKAGKLCKSWY